MTATLPTPMKNSTTCKERPPLEELKKDVRAVRDHLDDHDLLIEMRTEQRMMFSEIRDFRTSWAKRLEQLEADHGALKVRVYAALAVITAASWAVQIYVSWHAK